MCHQSKCISHSFGSADVPYQQNKKGRKEKAKKKEHSKKTFFIEPEKDLLLGTAKEPLMVLCNTSFVSNIL